MINMLALFGTEAVAFWTLFGGLCAVGSNIVLQLVIALCGYCYSIFRGMTRMQYTSSSGTEEIGTADFAYKLITNDAIQKLFTTLLIVAIILLVLSVIVKTITSEFNFQKDGNAKSKILFDAVKALALFIVVPIVSILGLMLANFLLGVIITALESTIGIAEWFNFTNLLEGIVGNVGWGSALNAVLSILGVMNFIMIGCMWPVAKKLLGATIGMFQRMFEIAMLWAISAPIIALMPLTEGPYKAWIKEYSSRVLGLFGVVVSVNVIVFMINIGNQCVRELGLGSFEKFIADLAVLYAGMAMIDGLASSIANMIGGKEYGAEGAKLGANMMGAVTNGLKKVAGAAGVATAMAGASKIRKAAKDAKKADMQERLNQDLADKKEQEELEKKRADTPDKFTEDDQKRLDKLKEDKDARDKRLKAYSEVGGGDKALKKVYGNRLSVSGRAKEKLKEFKKLKEQLGKEKAGSDAYKATYAQMKQVQDDLKGMGINDAGINTAMKMLSEGGMAAALNDEANIGKSAEDVKKAALERIGQRADDMLQNGVKVPIRKRNSYLGELMAERSAGAKKLHENADEARREYDKAQKDQDTAQISYDSAVEENSEASYELQAATDECYAAIDAYNEIKRTGTAEEKETAKQRIKTANSRLEVAKRKAATAQDRESEMEAALAQSKGKTESARSAWVTAQNRARNNDTFVRQTQKVMENPRAVKGAVIAGLSYVANGFFGSEKNLGDAWTAIKGGYHEIVKGGREITGVSDAIDITAEGLKAETAKLQKQYGEALKGNQSAIDMAKYVREMGLPVGSTPSSDDLTRAKAKVVNLDQKQSAKVQEMQAKEARILREREQAIRDGFTFKGKTIAQIDAQIDDAQTQIDNLRIQLDGLGPGNEEEVARINARIGRLKDARDEASALKAKAQADLDVKIAGAKTSPDVVVQNVAVQLQEAINTAIKSNNTNFDLNAAIQETIRKAKAQSAELDGMQDTEVERKIRAVVTETADAIAEETKAYSKAVKAGTAAGKYEEEQKKQNKAPEAPSSKS